MRRCARGAVMLIAGWAAGCAAGAGEFPPSPAPANAPLKSFTNLQAATQAALADAALRSGVAIATLQLVRAESVTWPDGALGCPQPGRLYTQAVVPGYRIRIDARSTLFDYHASVRGSLQLCPPGRSVEPAAGDGRV